MPSQLLPFAFSWQEEETTPAKAVPLASASLNKFLFVEPMQHYLNYSSLVIHDLIAQNRQGGQEITELIGADANAAKVWASIDALNPAVFSLAGHGNYTTTSVECTEYLMAVGDAKLSKMAGRVVHLNSCETGAELGPAIMTAGALAFVGSNESFWFYVGDDANTTRAVKSPFLAEWQFDVSLLKGKTVGEARADQLAKYEEELTYWVEGDGKNHVDASELARIINLNKTISTFAGESGTVPSPAGGGGTAPTAIAGIPLPALIVVGAIGVYFLLSRRRKRRR